MFKTEGSGPSRPRCCGNRRALCADLCEHVEYVSKLFNMFARHALYVLYIEIVFSIDILLNSIYILFLRNKSPIIKLDLKKRTPAQVGAKAHRFP